MTLARVPALLALAALSWPAAAQEHAPHHWSYEGAEGPTHWAELDTANRPCQLGTHQSPIDIRNAKPADLPAIAFSYQPTPLKVIDNGHTIQVTYAPGSSITVGDKRYELQQLHFHHPSEERLYGRSFPLVAHLVHKNAEGQLAVVAVLLSAGKANTFIDAVWKHLPAEQGKETAPDGVSVDASGLLPATRGYYTFTGSLTTPPCSEGVTWFVLKNPVEMSDVEVAEFAKKYPHNARPVQPLHGRVVQMTR